MMDMGDVADGCMNAMGSMMGGGMTSNSSIMLVVLMALLLIWVVGLGAVGALLFWAVSRLSRMRPDNSERP